MTVVLLVIGGWVAVEVTIALGKHKSEKFIHEEAVTKAALTLSEQITEFLVKTPPDVNAYPLYERFARRFEGRIDDARRQLDSIGLHSGDLDRLCDWHNMMNNQNVRKDLAAIASELKSLSEKPIK